MLEERVLEEKGFCISIPRGRGVARASLATGVRSRFRGES
jgi:hypothetical protein